MSDDTDFDEVSFIWSMTTRPEDARAFSLKFQPSWLKRVEFRPILQEIYNFLKEQGIPPSLSTLRKIFKDQDLEVYNNRVKKSLDEIENNEPDLSLQLYTLEKAKDVSIIRSLQEMIQDRSFLEKQDNLEGRDVLKDIIQWSQQHQKVADDPSYMMDDAVTHLMTEVEFDPKYQQPIPIGLDVIDKWCGGGLRPRQLGILMAPTGHGKSVYLTQATHKISYLNDVPVWYITNELTVDEATERFLARILGVNIKDIIRDPSSFHSKWSNSWRGRLNNIRISEYNREISTDELEADMIRLTNIFGWKPRAVCLDFMERMKPNSAGYDRNKEWNWIGAIAKDLVRFAKRHKILIWTACQTNRAGLSSEQLTLDMGQSSIKHFQEAAAVIGMKKIKTPANESDLLMFRDLKMRSAEGGDKEIILKARLGEMKIFNEEDTEYRAKVEEEAQKKLTRKKSSTREEKSSKWG